MTIVRNATLVGILAVLFAATAVLSARPSSGQGPASEPYVIDRVVGWPERWESLCGSDFCGIVVLPLAKIPASVTDQSLDVTVQVTFDYRTTKGDFAEVSAALDPPEQGLRSMRPGGFRVSSFRGSSTTLRWLLRDVPPAPNGYEVQISANPRDGNGDNRVRVTGRKATVEVVATPSQ